MKLIDLPKDNQDATERTTVCYYLLDAAVSGGMNEDGEFKHYNRGETMSITESDFAETLLEAIEDYQE